MTAPASAAAPASTARTALVRADHAWCRDTADEPLDGDRVEHLAAAVEASLGGRAVAPAAEVEQLRAALAIEEQRREDLRVELGKHVTAQERRAALAEKQRDGARVRLRAQTRDLDDLAELRRENDRLRGECDQLTVTLVRTATDRDAARADRDRLAGSLEETGSRVTAIQAEVEHVAELADQLALADVEPPPHRHAWEWQPGLTALPFPCACGLPWPPDRAPDR